ncbi:Uncharacterised protein [Mycolicibacterium aurum]|uniref:Uncharacterized protein n=1 Tax=Mycolicibacterium aurum TaxID=1791 RepID=A0A3S4VLT5_MYCAU|nr:hypothetical protein [Mycolicibacterium aurum]VEG54221.1 Uncharacterised protein [Mycolicibacterium aurum]
MKTCPGSGRELASDPPADEAATCPVCGRETKVDPKETDEGLTFTVEEHAQVVAGS